MVVRAKRIEVTNKAGFARTWAVARKSVGRKSLGLRGRTRTRSIATSPRGTRWDSVARDASGFSGDRPRNARQDRGRRREGVRDAAQMSCNTRKRVPGAATSTNFMLGPRPWQLKQAKRGVWNTARLPPVRDLPAGSSPAGGFTGDRSRRLERSSPAVGAVADVAMGISRRAPACRRYAKEAVPLGPWREAEARSLSVRQARRASSLAVHSMPRNRWRDRIGRVFGRELPHNRRALSMRCSSRRRGRWR